MFEGFDINKMQQMLQEVTQKAKELEEQSKKVEYCAKGGGGMLKVCANGAGEIVDIEIDDSLLEDKESLQILLISTINEALEMAKNAKQQQAMNLFGMNPFGNMK